MIQKPASIKRWYWRQFAGEVKRARHYLDLSNHSYLRLIAEAEKNKNWKEVKELEAEWAADVDGNRADYEVALSDHFVRRAAKYRVPTPKFGDPNYWAQSSFYGRWCLTVAGIEDIEKRIDEKRIRSASVFSARITPLVGLVGALTGLAAVILSHC